MGKVISSSKSLGLDIKEWVFVVPEDLEYYEYADLVIHCSKCDKYTSIAMPNHIHKFLDVTELMGGPLSTDNYSQFGLYCDHCKTMLALRFVKSKVVEETPTQQDAVIEDVTPIEDTNENK